MPGIIAISVSAVWLVCIVYFDLKEIYSCKKDSDISNLTKNL